jgi:hypothetical protein
VPFYEKAALKDEKLKAKVTPFFTLIEKQLFKLMN